MRIVAEVYKTQRTSVRGHNFAQAGVRFTVTPDRLAIDAGVGQRISHFGAERYYTVGLTLAGPVPRR